jgi:hypothetical protein
MTAAALLCSTIDRRSPLSSTDSGVVWLAGNTSPPTRYSIVPMSPAGWPDASSIDWMMCVTVVFPFVPVTPTIVSARDG